MSGAPDMEGQACCILEICCTGEDCIQAIATKIHDEVPNVNKHEAEIVARWIYAHYDLAPKGLLYPLVKFIAGMAREYPPHPGY